MRIKEFFNKKINVAWVTAVLILIAILTIYVASSHSKYVLEKELTFSLGIIESDEWNKRTLITGEELNQVLIEKGATQVVFGYENDFSNEIEAIEGTAVGLADETKSFAADDIKLYTVTDTENNITRAYILSEYQIKANANSSKMFYNHENLTNVLFLNFETTIVENMDSMFYGCKNLTVLDLYKFNTPKLTNVSNMFYDDILLETIYVSELWNLSGITTEQENVFYNCTKLVGGNQTTYDETKISSDYARIDTAAEGEKTAVPGYFTYKSKDTQEEQTTFNLIRPNTNKTDDKEKLNAITTTNTITTKNPIKTPNINQDSTQTETDIGTDDNNNENETDTNLENNNIDSNGDESLKPKEDEEDGFNIDKEKPS